MEDCLYLPLFQVLLQVLIVFTGNYNFFNLLTVVLSFSLLDEEHVGLWLGHGRRKASGGESPRPQGVSFGPLGPALHFSLFLGSPPFRRFI